MTNIYNKQHCFRLHRHQLNSGSPRISNLIQIGSGYHFINLRLLAGMKMKRGKLGKVWIFYEVICYECILVSYNSENPPKSDDLDVQLIKLGAFIKNHTVTVI